MSAIRKPGPNPNTVADGYSLSDERVAVSGPDIDFDYDDDGVQEDTRHVVGGMDLHLPDPDGAILNQSHIGEHRDDYGGVPVKLSGKVMLWATCAALNSCNLGYDIGVNTGAGPLIQESMDLSTVQLELFFGSINFFAIIGSLLAYHVSDMFGRRQAFITAAIFFICGVAIVTVAQDYTGLMVGRVFVGLGVGFGLALDPLYIAEIAPAKYRGEMVTLSEIATNVGIVLGFVSGLVFGGLADNVQWRYMIAMGGILPVIMIFLAWCVMAESPRWCVSKGQDERAEKILQEIYGKGYDVTPIITDIKEAHERELAAGRTVGWDMILFPSPAFRRMLLVGVGTAIAQQAVGVDAIQYFLVYILDESGIDGRGAQSGILIFLGLVKLLFIIVGGKLFDRNGRRPLFFVSLCGMTVALIILSINFFGGSHSAGLSIFALAVYLAFFSVGMGPGAWLIPSEVFASCIRAKAMSVATFCNRITATIMASTFLTTANAMSWAAFFFLLAIICIIVLIFMYFVLPETKGRSLEDMSVFFAELTGDRTILDAEDRIRREREAITHAETTAPRFEPPKARDVPREQLPDAKVMGTMI